MNDFFEKMEHSMYKVGKVVSDKAKFLRGVAKKKYNIVSKENEIKNTYLEIGKKVYQNKNKYMDVLGEKISKIDDLKEDIEELKQEIENLKNANNI